MASKTAAEAPAAAQPSPAAAEAAERRKRYKPVYDALEEGDYRLAYRMCERRDVVNTPLGKVSPRTKHSLLPLHSACLAIVPRGTGRTPCGSHVIFAIINANGGNMCSYLHYLQQFTYINLFTHVGLCVIRE
jgi:hypothetical protein